LNKYIFPVIPLLFLALFTGCASIERTTPGMMDGLDVVGGDSPALETVVVRNSGFSLFYMFTGICGDVDYSSRKDSIEGGCLLLQEKSQCSDCYRTMQAVANGERKSLTNVSMFNNSLPSGSILSYVSLIGFLVEFQDVGCSGVLRAKH